MTSNANPNLDYKPLEGYDVTGDQVVVAEIDSTTVTTTNGVVHGKLASTASGGGGGGAVTIADGAAVTLGTTTQTKATDGSVTSWSVIQLLKGIFDKLLNTIGVTQSGTWNITNVSGTVSLPTGAATSAKQPTIGTAGTPSGDVISVQGVASGTAQPVSGTVTANAGTGNMGSNLTQVAGNAIATGNNAVPTLNSASAGAVAAYGSNAAALTASTDYQFKWGAGGTTQVNHVMLQNNSGSSVSWDDSAATTAGSATLATGQTLFMDVQTANFHLQATGTPNVGGSSSNNIVVKGWL